MHEVEASATTSDIAYYMAWRTVTAKEQERERKRAEAKAKRHARR